MSAGRQDIERSVLSRDRLAKITCKKLTVDGVRSKDYNNKVTTFILICHRRFVMLCELKRDTAP